MMEGAGEDSRVVVAITPLGPRFRSANGSPSWNLKATWQGGEALTAQFSDPLSPAEVDEVRWYLEVFATNKGSPWETDRADRARDLLRSSGSVIFNALNLGVIKALEYRHIVIDIYTYEEDVSIFSLSWEVLETQSLWEPYQIVTIRRRLQQSSCILPSISSLSLSTNELSVLNILIVSSRPAAERDIAYRLIAEKIIKVVAELPKDSLRVNVELVRPGSWAAVEAQLSDRGPGFYHIAHLDCHGQVRAKDGKNGFYFDFLKRYGQGTYHKSGSEVALFLAKMGIKVVLTNACESAGVKDDMLSQPQAFVNAGIPMIVAMSYKVKSETAADFFAHFYRGLLESRLTCSAAARYARQHLQENQTRPARFGISVDLEDWILPVYYCSEETELLPQTSYDANDGLSAWLHSIEEPQRSVVRRAIEAYEIASSPFRTLIQKLKEVKIDLVGRDVDILRLETLLTTPVNGSHARKLQRRVLQLYGDAGVGKSHLLKHVQSWWKSTGFIDQALYVDCCAKKPDEPLMDFIFATLEKQKSTFSSDRAKMRQAIKETRVLLVIDSLDFVVLHEQAEPLDVMGQQLAVFLNDWLDSISFVFLGARQTVNSWIRLPFDLIWPYHLSNLDSNSAQRLARIAYERQSKERLLSSEFDAEELDHWLETLDYNPSAILLACDRLGIHKSPVTDFASVIEEFKATESIQFEAPRILTESVDAIMKSGDKSFPMLDHTWALCQFRRRIPRDGIDGWLWNLEVFKRLDTDREIDKMLTKEQILIVRKCDNREISEVPFIQDILSKRRATHEKVIAILVAAGLITEDILEHNGQAVYYWHVHPLLRLTMAALVSVPKDPEKMRSIFESNRIINATAYANFWFKRAFDYENDSFSRQQFAFEIDNVANALTLWSRSHMISKIDYMLLETAGRIIPFAELESREYRLMVRCYATVVEQCLRRSNEGWNAELFHNFLRATIVLQTTFVQVGDMQQLKYYNELLNRVVESNTDLAESDDDFRPGLMYARYVKGHLLFERGAIDTAETVFRDNIADTMLPTAETFRSSAFRIRATDCMNHMALWRCHMQGSRLPPHQLAKLAANVARSADAVSEDALRTIPSKAMAAMYEDLAISFRKWEAWLNRQQEAWEAFGPGYTPSELPGEMLSSETMDLFRKGLSNVQAAPLAMTSMGKGTGSLLDWTKLVNSDRGMSSEEVAEVLDGLENAVKKQADNSTVAAYHDYIIAVALKAEDWTTALNHLAEFKRLRKTLPPDEEAEQIHCYRLGMCYSELKRYAEATENFERVINNASANSVIRLRCYVELAGIQAGVNNDLLQAIRTLCAAGMLAYNTVKDVPDEVEGKLLHFIAKLAQEYCTEVIRENIPGKNHESQLLSTQHMSKIADLLNSFMRVKLNLGPLYDILEIMLEFVELDRIARVFICMLHGDPPFPTSQTSPGSKPPVLLFEVNDLDDTEQYFDWKTYEMLLFRRINVEYGSDFRPSMWFRPTNSADDNASKDSEVSSPVETLLNFATSGRATFETLIDHRNTNALETLLILMMLRDSYLRALHDNSSVPRLSHCHLYVVAPYQQQLELGDIIPSAVTDKITASLLHIKMLSLVGAKIDHPDTKGETPLFFAIKFERSDMVFILLTEGANIKHLTNDGQTVLHHAVENQSYKMVLLLIATGADLEAKDAKGMTPLAHAAVKENAEIVWALLSAGANSLSRDHQGYTPLARAMQQGLEVNVLLCARVLKAYDMNAYHDALFDCGYSYQNSLRLLDDSHVAPDVRRRMSSVRDAKYDVASWQHGVTYMHIAVMSGNREILDDILNVIKRVPHVFDHFKDNCLGWTLVHYAALNPLGLGRETVFELAQAGCDITVKDDFGYTPLDMLMTSSLKVATKLAAIYQQKLKAFRTDPPLQLDDPTGDGDKNSGQPTIDSPSTDTSDTAGHSEARAPVEDHELSKNELQLQREIEAWPHVFYLTADGRCKRIEKLCNVATNPIPRVWLIDESGKIQGVQLVEDDFE